MMDAPFTLALFGAFLASQAALARPRQLLGAGALVAVATLLKGPIGLVLGAVHLGAPWLSARRWPPARVLAGTLAVLGALAAPWFVAMLALHGDDFVTKFIVVEHLGKARIGRTLGGELSLALLPLLAVVPWVPFARPRPRTPWRAWLLVCAGVVAAYALQESRQLHYALPCAPFMALLVAERPSRWLRHALVGVFALAAALALFAAAIATPLPLRAVLAVLVLVATLGAVAAHRQQWLLAGLGLTALSTLALVGIPAVALPRSWPPALAAHVGAERVLMAGDEVGMARLETGVDLHRADRGPAPGDGLWLQRQVDPPPPGAVRLFTWPRLRQRVPPADLTAVLETGTLEPLLEPWELLRLPPGP